MRLSVAASVLAGTLPASAETTVDSLRVAIAEQISPKRLLGHVVPRSSPHSSPSKSTIPSNWGQRKRAAVARLQNPKSVVPPPAMECDPDVGLLACGFGHRCQPSDESALGGFCAPIAETSPKECSPDIGLLACGHGRYCYASNESSLGGFCAPIASKGNHRDLQGVELGLGRYCDPDFIYYGLVDCDCSQWDTDRGAGTVLCRLYENYCIPFCAEANTCYALEATYTNDGVNYPSNVYCYNIETPIKQYFCYGNIDADTCTISLDGTECNSCTISFEEYCKDGTCFDRPCFNYDCRNIGLGRGNTCQEVLFPPAFDECLDTFVAPPDGPSPSIGFAAYCDPNVETDRQLSCDCSGFDGSTGTITCSLFDNYCIPECATQTCFSEELIYTTDGVDSSTVDCYTITAPYQQEFCHAVDGPSSCSISLDGVECSSCIIIPGDTDQCYAYDCENVGLRTGLSCVQFPQPPALRLCPQAPPVFTSPPVQGPTPGEITDAPTLVPEAVIDAPSLVPEAVTEAPAVSSGGAAPSNSQPDFRTASPTAAPFSDAPESPTDSPAVVPPTSPTGSPDVLSPPSPTGSPDIPSPPSPTGSPDIPSPPSPTGSPDVLSPPSPTAGPVGNPPPSPTAGPVGNPPISPTAGGGPSPGEIADAPSLVPEAVTAAPVIGSGGSLPSESPAVGPPASPTAVPVSDAPESPTDSPDVVPPTSPTAGPPSPTGPSFQAGSTNAPAPANLPSAGAKTSIVMLGATTLLLAFFSC